MTTIRCELRAEGMHCTSCGLLIDETVEDLDGVERCSTDVRRGRVLVTYEPGRITPESIAAAITDAGYPARITAASTPEPRA